MITASEGSSNEQLEAVQLVSLSRLMFNPDETDCFSELKAASTRNFSRAR